MICALRKHAVETIETLDFLKEIVEAVPDPSAGGTIDLEAERNVKRSKRAAAGSTKAAGGGKGKKTKTKKQQEEEEEEEEEEDE